MMLALFNVLLLAAPNLAAPELPASPVSTEGAGEAEAKNSWVLHADKIYTSTGDVIENGTVTVRDGKIVSVTPGGRASDDDLQAGAITAGMIDASVRIGPGMYSVEQSNEIQPHARVSGSIDPFDRAWDRQLRSGVTTALVAPRDDNVIGGLGVVVKTGGEKSVAGRTLREDAVLRGAMGSQPSSRNHPAFGRPTDFYSRRPTTRMGVEWEWRKAFYDAAASTRDAERAFPGSEVLLAALEGEMPVVIQAWATQDIRTAVFLKEELAREGMGDIRLILDASAEAWKEPQLLTRTSTAVVLPPMPDTGRTTDGAWMAWNTAALLHEQGITVALSSHGRREVEARLNVQVGYAMRGGLPFDAALAAVTINPARMLGVEDRVGSIETGKDADLVLWSGTPFEASSRVMGVLLDGELVLDPRENK